MGSSASTVRDVKLVQQEELLCATEPRFCLPAPMTLRLPHSIWYWGWGINFQITDSSKDLVYFHCLKDRTARDLPCKNVVTDLAGGPIFYFKDQLTATTHKYKFFKGQLHGSYPELCAFDAWDKGVFSKYKHKIEVTDVLTYAKKKIIVRATSKTIGRRECVIYYVGPENKEIPVGKIYPENPNPTARNVDYMLEVATGVDIALMLIAVIPLKLQDPPRPGGGVERTNDGVDFDFGGNDGGGGSDGGD